jgi:hypothetical protein
MYKCLVWDTLEPALTETTHQKENPVQLETSTGLPRGQEYSRYTGTGEGARATRNNVLVRSGASVDSRSKIWGSVRLLSFIFIFIVGVIVTGGQDRHQAVDDFYGESFTKTGQEGDGIGDLRTRHLDRR